MLGDIARVYSGGTPSRAVSSYWGSGIPWVTTAEIGSSVITSSKEEITGLGLARSTAKIAPKGALIMAMYGQGKTRGKTSILGMNAAINQACAAIEPGGRVDADYLLAYLQHNYDMIRGLSNTGGQENLSGQIIKRIPIKAPVLILEQRRISDAIRDFNGIIAVLERLIAKKRAIKQGVMLQLLSGRMRLNYFRGFWVHRRVSDLIDRPEAGVSVRSASGTTGDLYILKTSSVQCGKFVPTEAKPIERADASRARCSPTRGSMIISRMNTPELVGEVGYVNETRADLFLPDRLWLARPKRGVSIDMRWLTYYFASETGARQLRGLATGTSGSMKNIPKDRFLSLDVRVPVEDEQRAIADILSDIDAEIEILQTRLEKACDIKTGMMQELLTGHTRLPVEVAS